MGDEGVMIVKKCVCDSVRKCNFLALLKGLANTTTSIKLRK